MSRIEADHLAREAIVYVRQSTVDQVINNLESKRRQYALADRARALGWLDVVVLDEDLGRSGSGVTRPGFERLLAAICQGSVGAVVSIEASRLARNGRDWHTLLEFCALVGTLIVDENGIFDPRLPDDRLLLGMKGTLSEMELSTFRQRSPQERNSSESKPGRTGQKVVVELSAWAWAPKFVWGRRDPDRRVPKPPLNWCSVSSTGPFGSIRQVLLWLRQEQIELPCARGGSCSVGRVQQCRLALAGVRDHPSYPDQPGLCRSLYLWTRVHQHGDRACGWKTSRAPSSRAYGWPAMSGPCCYAITMRAISAGTSSRRTSAPSPTTPT